MVSWKSAANVRWFAWRSEGAYADPGSPASSRRLATESEIATMTPEIVKKALRQVKDPELGLNIMDIGLVYDVTVSDAGDVHVKMTLTSPGCPAGPEILQDAKSVIEELEGVHSAAIELVWEPYWTPERMDPRVKSFMGF